MKQICAAFLAFALLCGCFTPIPKSETIPVFPTKPAATIGIAVADHREFILDDDKEEWFEGIVRGIFGIPYSYTRLDEFDEKPFAYYLASKLKDSVENAAGKATIVQLPKGTPPEKAIQEIANANVDSGIMVMMFQSRYDIGVFGSEYNYYFDLYVLGRGGRVIGRKAFHQLDREIPISETHNILDSMSEIYKRKFDGFLADPEIKNALNAAAAGS